ncbi:hypothetical protein LUX57_23900 [Actinomadura madurae]|nr:hypothetical protein [Actinomadura madurae]MCP9967805.1 hypothetical protein [Actinomadura madurae]
MGSFYPRFVPQVTEVNRGVPGQWVVRGQGEEEFLVEQRDQFHGGLVVHGLPGGDQGQIDAAVPDRHQRITLVGLVEAECHAGMGVTEAADGLGHKGRVRAREGGQPQLTGVQGGEGGQVVFHRPQAREGVAGEFDRDLSGGGGAHAAGQPLEEVNAEPLFQPGDLA